MIPELLKKRELSDNSWIVKVEDIKDFDISAKNLNKKAEAEIRKPDEIVKELQENESQICNYLEELGAILNIRK
jgi:type I restriction enzyme M protein